MKDVNYESTNVAMRLLSYDIPSNLKGFDFITEAVQYKISHPHSKFQDIYSAIAATHSQSALSVMRDIGYAIKQSYKLGSLLHLSNQQLYSSRVISTIAIHIKSSVPPPPRSK